jgi:hypothetical protein
LLGELVATGIERIHNPGNLKWFQNIELTALNTMALGVQAHQSGSRRAGEQNGVELFESPPLVEYKKEGAWTYYRKYAASSNQASFSEELSQHFPTAWADLWYCQQYFDTHKQIGTVDSLCVDYEDNYVVSLVGQGSSGYVHWVVEYYAEPAIDGITPYFFHHSRNPFSIFWGRPIRACGELDVRDRPVGEWKRFNRRQEIIKIESYTDAWRKEDEDQW